MVEADISRLEFSRLASIRLVLLKFTAGYFEDLRYAVGRNKPPKSMFSRFLLLKKRAETRFEAPIPIAYLDDSVYKTDLLI